MNLLSENRPETCLEVGLECGTCVRKAATTVARVCLGLDAAATQHVFLQVFTSPGCLPMAPAFELAYHEASQPRPMLAASSAAAA